MNFIGHNRSRWKLKGLSRIIHVLATLRGEFWCWVDNKTKNVYVHFFESHVTGIVFLTVISRVFARRDKSVQYYTNIIMPPFWPYSVWLSMSIELFGLLGKTRLSFFPSVYTNTALWQETEKKTYGISIIILQRVHPSNKISPSDHSAGWTKVKMRNRS